MSRIICIGLILGVLITGCAATTPKFFMNGTEITYDDEDGYDVIYINDYGRIAQIYLEYNDYSYSKIITFCEDEVVCYEPYSEGGSCFRHKDLVEKYCGIVDAARENDRITKAIEGELIPIEEGVKCDYD